VSSRAFWELVDRLQIPDANALEVIGYPGKIGTTGKRPRFRLSTRQTKLALHLPGIEAALQAIGEPPSWLRRRNRSAPFSGRAPLEWMAEQGAMGWPSCCDF
jgi:hypothetical protein